MTLHHGLGNHAHLINHVFLLLAGLASFVWYSEYG